MQPTAWFILILAPFSFATNADILDAAEEGNVFEVTRYLEEGEEVNKKSFFKGKTALHYAAEAGHSQVVKLLIEKGADLEVQNNFGDTPLHYAVENDQIEAAKLLIDAGARFYREIAEKASDEITNYYLKQLKIINEMDKANFLNGLPPIHYAIKKGWHDTALLLIKRGADINITSMANDTPLQYAIKYSEDEEIVKLLIDNGADLTLSDSSGQTILHQAAKEASFAIDYILDAGLKIDIKDKAGRTPLMVAVQNKNLDGAKMLIQRGSDVRVKDNSDSSPIHYATRTNLSMLTTILDAGAKIDDKDDLGRTALVTAAQENNPRIVEELVRRGSDVGISDNSSKSAFQYTLDNNNLTLAQIIFETGNIDIDAKDDSGRTLLFTAVQEKNKEKVSFLINHGANVDILDNKNQSPIYYAIHDNNKEIVEAIVDSGANVTEDHMNSASTLLYPILARPYAEKHLSEILGKITSLLNDGKDQEVIFYGQRFVSINNADIDNAVIEAQRHLGMTAFNKGSYEEAVNRLSVVPNSHASYEETNKMINKAKELIAEKEKKEKKEKEEKEKEKRRMELAESKVSDAAMICKKAAEQSAKWGYDSDWTPKYDAYLLGDDTIIITGRDIQFKNGFGAKRYAEYTGRYSITKGTCYITSID